MEQLNLYDYLGKEEDPVYELLETIEENSSLKTKDFEVKLNQHGLYEISNEDYHECKETIYDCYTFIQKEMLLQI